jgi:hypothetical protein
MAYGLARATVLGLLERDQEEEEPDDEPDEPIVAATEPEFTDMRRISDRRKDSMQ